MSSWSMRRATSYDWPEIAALLAAADLPLAGAQAHLSNFFLAFRDDVLIGSAGLERYGDTALLRSVAVASTERRRSLGQALVRQALAYAASLGVCQVVLLTTTAADFFLRFGFQPISRGSLGCTGISGVSGGMLCLRDGNVPCACGGAKLMNTCIRLACPVDTLAVQAISAPVVIR